MGPTRKNRSEDPDGGHKKSKTTHTRRPLSRRIHGLFPEHKLSDNPDGPLKKARARHTSRLKLRTEQDTQQIPSARSLARNLDRGISFPRYDSKDPVGEEQAKFNAAQAAVPPITAQRGYSDPVECWVMNISLPDQTKASMRSRPALQPGVPASNASRKRSLMVSRQGSMPDSEYLAATSSSSGRVYTNPGFRAQMEEGAPGVGLHMDEAEEDEGPIDEDEEHLDTLRETLYDTSADERYKPEVLSERLKRLENKNEVTVIHCLHDLACPAAEDLAALNIKNKELRAKYILLVDHWNERWQRMPQLMPGFPQPQPDYCVGFARKAFSRDELDRLGAVTKTTSSFTATAYTYFPFLTCEVKSHKAPVYEADNQNAYSMMLAVTAAVDLFRAAQMEESAHRRVLGFALYYNHMIIRLDAYYPIIAGPRTDIYRKNMYEYHLPPNTAAASSSNNITWQSWHFVRNIYESWAPKHLERLRQAINSLEITPANTARAAAAAASGLQMGDTNNMIDSATPTSTSFAHAA